MTTIHTLVLAFHVLVGAIIIGLVLVQRGKGAETGAAFGSGSSGTVFGAKGSANFLSRSTAVLAALFFATSLGLAYLTAERPVEQSLVRPVDATPAAQPAPGTAETQPDGLPAIPEAPAAGPADGEAPSGDGVTP